MLAPGTVLQSRYHVTRQLGQGGMGAVYEATDGRLRSTVALKEAFASTEEARHDFEREAHLLANLRHAALPKVTDHFSEGEGHFLVMEFIPGEDFEQKLDRRALPFDAAEVAGWADTILRALEYLHARRPPVFHRDIKPANLKLTDEGELYLLDFGLAKGLAGQMTTAHASRSVRAYTLSYASPEQIQGTGTDARSDIYSLGATLYHLLTKVVPPDALARAMSLAFGKPDPLTPPHALTPRVPASLSAFLARAVAFDPQERFQSATEMRRELDLALRTRPAHEPPAPPAAEPEAAPHVEEAAPQSAADVAPSPVGPSSPAPEPPPPPKAAPTVIASPSAVARRAAPGAESEYQRAAEVEPENSYHYEDLGRVLFEQGNFSESEAALRRALALRPESPEAHHTLAAALAAQSDFEGAHAEYREALRLNPNRARYHSELGWLLLMRLDDYARAEAAFREAIRIDPLSPRFHSGLGWSLYKQGRFPQAGEAFGEAVRTAPKSGPYRKDLARYYNGLGNCLDKQGRAAEARDAYERAAQLDPEGAVRQAGRTRRA